MSDEERARLERERIRRVINATGIVLHTGLGRAVLPRAAAEALVALEFPCNMQIDLQTGERGKRNYTSERLLAQLTGAQAAMIVNNNAAATLLILRALCRGRDVIVSRGQLIEIGGAYRLPDCITESGARIVAVGTTNATYAEDYERAITPETGALLRVNPSNYRVRGHTHSVSIGELAAMKKAHDLVVIDDLGCGALIDMQQFGLPAEPTVRASIEAGADLVCFSGDKLVGGPQAGIIAGRADLIARLKRHPLTRMLRVCKLTDAALEHTLRLFADPATLCERNPTLRMIAASPQALRERAAALAAEIGKEAALLCVEVKAAQSAVGGGSMPEARLPTSVVALRCRECSARQLSALLRRHEPPLVARICEDEVWIDLRTILEGEEPLVRRAVLWAEARVRAGELADTGRREDGAADIG